MRRARETADCIAEVTGSRGSPDAGLRERLNWDGGMPFQAFLALWAQRRGQIVVARPPRLIYSATFSQAASVRVASWSRCFA